MNTLTKTGAPAWTMLLFLLAGLATAEPIAFVGVDVLPSGRDHGDRRSTLSPARLRCVLNALCDRYDVIVIDAPAAPVAPQTGLAARLAETVVLTLCIESTRRLDVEEALRSLGRRDRRATVAVMAAPARRNAGRAPGGSTVFRAPPIATEESATI